MRTFLDNLFFSLCYFYYFILTKTVKANLIGNPVLQQIWNSGKNVVICTPHNCLLALFVGTDAGKLKRPIIMLLASLSQDGELISHILKKRRYEVCRGSSSVGGKRALFQLKRAGKEGKSLGLAYDGPKGPPLIPKRGVLGCARAIDGAIFMAYVIDKPNPYFPFFRSFRVKSWDRFLVPVPFCALDVHFEKIPTKEELKITSESEYETFVQEHIQKRGVAIYGHLYQNR